MSDKPDNVQKIVKRKKTTCPKGIGKSEAEMVTELALKILRGYYQIYTKK